MYMPEWILAALSLLWGLLFVCVAHIHTWINGPVQNYIVGMPYRSWMERWLLYTCKDLGKFHHAQVTETEAKTETVVSLLFRPLFPCRPRLRLQPLMARALSKATPWRM